jgi:hypothetical protein
VKEGGNGLIKITPLFFLLLSRWTVFQTGLEPSRLDLLRCVVTCMDSFYDRRFAGQSACSHDSFAATKIMYKQQIYNKY